MHISNYCAVPAHSQKRASTKNCAVPSGQALMKQGRRDIRRTVATGMANIGVQPHIIEAVLNHISGHKAGVAGVYNRAIYTAEKRAALQRWADHVRFLVDGVTPNILRFPEAVQATR